MHWLHRSEVKSMCNMLDQHSGIHFTETSAQETLPTPTDTSIPLCTPSQILISAAPLSAFSGSLSLVCLPTFQVTFLLLLASPTATNSSSPRSVPPWGLTLPCPPLLWAGFGAPCQPHSPCCWGQQFVSRAHGVRTWPPSNSDDKHWTCHSN